MFLQKTETITIIDEGYTKVNGAIVLDFDNIQDYAIYNDTYYNATLIIDNVKRGVSVVLKDGDYFSTLASATLQEGNSSISFSNGTNIGLITKNLFGPATITGAELKEKMNIDSGADNLIIENLSIYNYICGQCSNATLEKIVADGVVLSMFDGLFQWRNEPDISEEGGDGRFEWIAFFREGGYSLMISGYQKNTPLSELPFKSVSCTYPISLGFDNIEDTKEYSTQIQLMFADGTTETIKTSVGFIEHCFYTESPIEGE